MNCIQCRSNPAKFREADEASRVYCSRECFYIGLKDDDEIVGLQTSDGEKIQVPKEIALKMNTVAYLIEDAGVDNWIPLPRVHSKQLRAILEALEREKPSREEFLNRFEAAIFLDAEPFILQSYREFANIIGNTTDLNLLRRFKDQVNRVIYFMNLFEMKLFIGRCDMAQIKVDLMREKYVYLADDSTLDVSVMLGLIEDVKFLFEMGFTVPDMNITLGYAISNKHFDVAKYLITEKGFTLDIDSMEFSATNQLFKNRDFIIFLFNRGLIDQDGLLRTFFRYYFDETVVITLIDDGLITVDNAFISSSIMRGKLDVLKHIINRVTIDDSLPEFKGAFEYAVTNRTRDIDVVEFLLSQGLFQDEEYISNVLERRRHSMYPQMIQLLENRSKRIKKS